MIACFEVVYTGVSACPTKLLIDPTTFGAAQVWQSVFESKKHRFDIHIHHPVPFALGVFMKRLDVNHSRVIDQDIQGAELFDRPADRIAHLSFAADIATQGERSAWAALQYAG